MSTPVAYLRKSRVTLASPGELSHESQLEAVKALAAQHGDPEPVVLSDWSRSGRHGTRRRPGYAELVRMIESGEASAVYSYSLSRLSRSMRDFAELVEIAQRRNVPVRLARDTLNLATASGRLNVNVLASVSAFEAEIAQERARDTIAARRARGDAVGSAPYGYILSGGKLHEDPDRPVAPVLDAYREAGSYAGAAKLLNDRKQRPARDGEGWSGPAVRRVVNRAMPETRSRDGRPGRKPRRDFALSGLLTCPCGTTMTGRREPRRTRYGSYEYVSYQCWRGRYRADHPRPFMVNEGQVLPWVKAEVARMRLPEAVDMEQDDDDDGTRAALDDKRRRIVETYIEGLIDKAERDRRLEFIADELDRRDARMAVVAVPSVDWSWAPSKLNAVLRAILRSVQLGPDLRPVSADWKLPAEYIE